MTERAFEKLNKNNFVIFAAKCYDNPNSLTTDEFEKDLSIFKHLRRLVLKILHEKDTNLRLIMNHIITLYNVFGIRGSTSLIFSYFTAEELSIIKPILIYFSYLKSEDFVEIPLHQKIVEKLRKEEY